MTVGNRLADGLVEKALGMTRMDHPMDRADLYEDLGFELQKIPQLEMYSELRERLSRARKHLRDIALAE